MSVKSLAASASRGVSRQIFIVKRHSPVLLFGLGAVGFVSTCALSVRATLKLSDVLDATDKKLAEVDDGSHHVVEDEADKKPAKFGIKLQTSIEIAKLYALPVVVGAASVAALTGSHIILTKRNTSLVAAYATVDSMFKKYRSRVREELGDDKDREFRFGVAEKAVVDPETGAVENARGIDAEAVKKRAEDGSDYAVMFDKWNENWEPSYKQNIFYLDSVIQRFENVMRLRGWVMLFEIYEAMGYEPTEASFSVGWIKDANLTGDGDGYISFGLERNTENAIAFLNGTRHDVLLDPNVDGVITHKFRKKV